MISKKHIYFFATGVLIIIVAVYLLLSIYITTVAIKATRKIPDTDPSSVQLSYIEEEFYTKDKIKLSGWFIENESLNTVIMIHGVDSNKSDGYMLDLIKDIYNMGYSVFAFDLRAHGNSEGKDLGLAYVERIDLDAAIQHLKHTHNVEQVVLHGISYGGTIAVSNSDLDQSIEGIVVDSAFYDLPELLASEVSSRTFIPEFLAKLLKFGIIRTIDILYGIRTDHIISGIQSVSNFDSPIMIFHCIADDRIPISHSDRINQFSPIDSYYIIYDNCEHAKGYEENPVDFTSRLKEYFAESFN